MTTLALPTTNVSMSPTTSNTSSELNIVTSNEKTNQPSSQSPFYKLNESPNSYEKLDSSNERRRVRFSDRNLSNSQVVGNMSKAISNSTLQKSAKENSNVSVNNIASYESRKRTKNIWRTRLKGIILDLEVFQTVLSILSAVFFIISSYIQIDVDGRLFALVVCDLIFSCFFIVLFIVNFLLAKNKILFFITPLSILDYVTVVPSLTITVISFTQDSFNSQSYAFVGLLRVLRLLRLIPITKKISSKGEINSVIAKVIELALTVACFLVIFSGFFQWLENYFGDRTIYFHDALYFIAITLVTIGYGDISPSNVASRYAVILFFLIGVTIIPIQISQIYDIVTSEKSIFKVKNFTLKNHTIVSGSCRIDEAVDFIKECFQRRKKKIKRVILIFKNENFCKHLLESLKKTPYRSKIYVYCGDIMDFETMNLLKLPQSRNVFLLNSPKIGNARKQDTSIIMTTIALRNFNKSLKVYAQINLMESKPYLIRAGAKVIICNEILCTKILSASVSSCGFTTFLFNLLSGAEITLFSKNRSKTSISGDFQNAINMLDNESKWIAEYAEGLNCEIFRVKFSPAFYNNLFIDAAKLLLTTLEVVVFALEDTNGKIFINPSRYLIKEGDQCFCLAKSFKHAQEVENYQYTENEDNSHSKKKLKSSKPFLYSKTAIDNLGDDFLDFNYVEYTTKEQMKFEESSQSEKEIMKISEKQIDNQNRKQLARRSRILEPTFKKDVKTRKRSGSSSEPKIVDVSLLRKDEEITEDGIRHAHLEVLLKLLSPDAYFIEKRQYLKQIRDTLSPEQSRVEEQKFFSNVINNYGLLQAPRSKEEFLITSYQVPILIKDHILILGEFQQPAIICSVIRSIQRKNRLTPIVFMSHLVDKYFNYLYERLKFFSHVYFIQGNPMKHFELRRAGYQFARTILYLTQDEKIINLNDHTLSEEKEDQETEYSIDAEAIKLALGIEANSEGNKCYLLELANRSNLKFIPHEGVGTFEKTRSLQEKGIIEHNLDDIDLFCLFSDLHISSKIFPSSSFLSRLLAQSFHNKRVVDLIDQMCADEFLAGDSQSVVFEVPVPPMFVSGSVFELVTTCFDNDLILLALSREKPFSSEASISHHQQQPQHQQQQHHNNRYIYTNPSFSTILRSSDILFLCGHKNDFTKLSQQYKDTHHFPNTTTMMTHQPHDTTEVIVEIHSDEEHVERKRPKSCEIPVVSPTLGENLLIEGSSSSELIHSISVPTSSTRIMVGPTVMDDDRIISLQDEDEEDGQTPHRMTFGELLNKHKPHTEKDQ
ncbi:hypothetical protein C9374_003426 [Naegleria lovaniensis]|uniref:BK channel n=1 Tax=Naegleria lovaniensis TaxID=51637 RepID=A0AA88GTP6_NAELO|nr:uncharacterized protein C9374_003426 [Naegleria lovaniensis]KAG2385611.1 hypothetical protein C9374_003426 [Naegleria lovaniensis]